MQNCDTERPFVDYYGRNNISPVAQDISDYERHCKRREALYRHLGIAPGLIKGKSILEFGPGSGHNSVFTAGLGPSRYLLVDGNPTGLESVKKLLADYEGKVALEVVESYIEDFQSSEKFDLVLCEGLISTQRDPSSFTRHVASFVADRGLLVITCMDTVPLAAETLRQICAGLIIDDGMSFEQKLAVLLPVFSPHLAALKGMSRFHADWIMDNLIHRWIGPLYSIPQAIDSLSDQFEAFGFSPHFVTDWRFYKNIWGNDTRYNELPKIAYLENLHNFIDYRFTWAPRDESQNKHLIDVCDALFELRYPREKEAEKKRLATIISHVGTLVELVGQFSKETAEGFEGCLRALEEFRASGQLGNFGRFESLWGRGQQYVSFMRTTSY